MGEAYRVEDSGFVEDMLMAVPYCDPTRSEFW